MGTINFSINSDKCNLERGTFYKQLHKLLLKFKDQEHIVRNYLQYE